MSPLQWVTVVTCAAEIALALAASTRIRKSPLALPFVVWSTVIAVWNFAALAYDVTGHAGWRYVDTSVSVFTTSGGLHFVAAFVGKRRAFRKAIVACYAMSGILSAATAAAFVVPALRSFPMSEAWAWLHLCLIAIWVPVMLVMLVQHLREHPSDRERTRTRLFFAAFIVGAAFGSSELLVDLGITVPRLGSVAMFITLALVGIIGFRFQLFERDLSAASGVYALAAAAVGMLAYVLVIRGLTDHAAVQAFGFLTVTALVIVAGYRIVVGYREERERMERLAVLGRLSSQMAHDLKNPLAALKGAVQFLKEERRQGRSLDDQEAFLDLMEADVERLSRLVDKYRRLETVAPKLARVDLNALVAEVAALAPHASTDVTFETDLASDLPKLEADEDLIVAALENIVQNAIEALPDGGTVRIATHLEADTEPARILVTVTDDGEGMGARLRERIFEELYTTKAGGSGLGLAFCKRVAEAHDGAIDAESREGEGTTIRLYLPV